MYGSSVSETEHVDSRMGVVCLKTNVRIRVCELCVTTQHLHVICRAPVKEEVCAAETQEHEGLLTPSPRRLCPGHVASEGHTVVVCKPSQHYA